MSTLCAGCGHDSITAAIVEACWELDAARRSKVVKLSGIGCSSKTTAYFVSGAHGFNSVHGRMPSIATGANAANRELTYIGVSGDGDSLSIGLGQLVHAIRRNVNMLYIIENNGVYGLTKGQFSASADIGTKAKKGEANSQPPIDPVLLALTLGATFVARSFSGDKAQLVPLIQAGLRHDGFALIDVLSPCVTFNDHEGSTKSYAYTREHYQPAVEADFVPPAQEITADYAAGEALPVRCTTAAASCCASSTRPTTHRPGGRAGEGAGAPEDGGIPDRAAVCRCRRRREGAAGVPPSQRHPRGAVEQPAVRDAVTRLQGPDQDPGPLPLTPCRQTPPVPAVLTRPLSPSFYSRVNTTRSRGCSGRQLPLVVRERRAECPSRL